MFSGVARLRSAHVSARSLTSCSGWSISAMAEIGFVNKPSLAGL